MLVITRAHLKTWINDKYYRHKRKYTSSKNEMRLSLTQRDHLHLPYRKLHSLRPATAATNRLRAPTKDSCTVPQYFPNILRHRNPSVLKITNGTENQETKAASTMKRENWFYVTLRKRKKYNIKFNTYDSRWTPSSLVVTICSTRFTLNNSTFCIRSAFGCLMFSIPKCCNMFRHLLGHLQALWENRSKSYLYFNALWDHKRIWDPTMHWNIDSSWICFPRGPEDGLIKVEICRPDNILFLWYIK